MTDKRPSERYLLLIGNIAAYWSLAELMCDHALAALLRIDPDQARRLNMATADFRVRLEMLDTTSGRVLADREALEEFRSILEQLGAASECRNRVVHSIWFNLGYEDRTRTRYRFKRGSEPIAESEKFTLEALQAILDRIKDATEALTGFLLDRLGMPPVQPGLVIEYGGHAQYGDDLTQ